MRYRSDELQVFGRPIQSSIRKPIARDAIQVNKLIAACKPLDSNSIYCNLLQCTHFANTCALAVHKDEAIGFVSAYVLPQQPATLFVWQIAVAPEARHQGLGKRLIKEILSRQVCAAVTHLEASITEHNEASWKLFLSLAEEYGCHYKKRLLFDKQKHFSGQHETELLIRVGPLKNPHLPAN